MSKTCSVDFLNKKCITIFVGKREGKIPTAWRCASVSIISPEDGDSMFL
jgi:hypothetical protein